VTQLGPAADNLYLVGAYAPVTDNSVPGIAQFNREADAAGSTVARNENMLQVRLAIHVGGQRKDNPALRRPVRERPRHQNLAPIVTICRTD
jgi:hypothetical protein